jgi:hypothetical protein
MEHTFIAIRQTSAGGVAASELRHMRLNAKASPAARVLRGTSDAFRA